MSEPFQTTATAKIGGVEYLLKWNNLSNLRLAHKNHKDFAEHGEFYQVCIFAFCMLPKDAPFSNFEDMAATLEQGEEGPLAEAVTKVAASMNPKGEADDPLSENGPSPEEGSD